MQPDPSKTPLPSPLDYAKARLQAAAISPELLKAGSPAVSAVIITLPYNYARGVQSYMQLGITPPSLTRGALLTGGLLNTRFLARMAPIPAAQKAAEAAANDYNEKQQGNHYISPDVARMIATATTGTTVDTLFLTPFERMLNVKSSLPKGTTATTWLQQFDSKGVLLRELYRGGSAQFARQLPFWSGLVTSKHFAEKALPPADAANPTFKEKLQQGLATTAGATITDLIITPLTGIHSQMTKATDPQSFWNSFKHAQKNGLYTGWQGRGLVSIVGCSGMVLTLTLQELIDNLISKKAETQPETTWQNRVQEIPAHVQNRGASK